MAESQTAAANTGLLSLNTIIQRPFINIDGKPYYLRHPNELSLMDRHQVLTGLRSLGGVDQVGKADADDAVAQAAAALRGNFLKVLIGGEEVVDKLTDDHRLQVLRCFFDQAGPMVTTTAPPAAGNGTHPKRPRPSRKSRT